MRKLKILIVDESYTFLHDLKEYLLNDSSIVSIVVTTNPFEAFDILVIESFDYIICQINMSIYNGLDFAIKAHTLNNTPIILTDVSEKYREEVKKLNNVIFCKRPVFERRCSLKCLSSYLTVIKAHLFQTQIPENIDLEQIIVIGASAGGTEAIDNIISHLPPITPPIIVCQHLPKEFSYMFSTKLTYKSKLSCKVGKNGEYLLPSQVYVCEGNAITTVHKSSEGYYLKVTTIIEDIHPLPNINCLFESLADVSGEVIAVILTGMGVDGAKGIAMIKDKGGYTIAQDEQTSLVYGMPKEAAATGKIDAVLPIQSIAEEIVSRIHKDKE
ncbi:MAG: hypothetical protein LBM99_03990 [Bacillales bacterium]|jgi:two-component system chemotaxis response regulator CheB|nr:hypothetical protein [Bacillales bacterium]